MKSLFPVVLIGTLCLSTLVGCATTVALTPAADAINPVCASVIVQLPDTASGLQLRETNAQGTGAWGDPSAALLFCGVAIPGPSTLLCYQVNGVDWLFDPTNEPNMSYTTFGRDPAIQVIVNEKKASPGNVLLDLSNAVDATAPTGRHCSSVAETLGDGTSSETPGPSVTPSPSN